jgi:oxaloacetate decarboxylase alpha subunit/pyruvate carboxylase subunit B
MLLRGQNIVQYTSFPDDVVEAFVSAMAKAGMDIMRIFDACNDIRNLKTAIKAVKKSGKHARGELCYTTSPVHTVEAFVEMAVALEKEGCDSVAIKDMSGVIAPQVAYAMVKEIKRRVGVPLTLHSHDTAGLAATSYYAAVEAGVDAIETSIVPFANGTAQPDTVRMLALLEGHARCPSFDGAKLQQLRVYFTEVYGQLSKFTAHANEIVDSDTLCYQVPGGMLSNFRNQLKEQGMTDKFEQVLLEIPYIRKCLGWIPLVTPTSQIVGTQAMLNVKFGRWKNFSQPAMDIALGKYGRTPGPIDSEVLKLAMEKTGQKPLECRPADLLKPRMDTLRADLTAKGLPTDDEACVLYAMFPVEFAALYKKPAPTAPAAVSAAPTVSAPKPAVSEVPLPAKKSPVQAPQNGKSAPRRFTITVEGLSKEVSVEELS